MELIIVEHKPDSGIVGSVVYTTQHNTTQDSKSSERYWASLASLHPTMIVY